MEDFLAAVQEARQEYLDDYRPELERLARERDAKRESSKKEQLARLMQDMKVGSKSAGSANKVPSKAARSTEDLSKPIDEEYEGDGQIIEPVSCGLITPWLGLSFDEMEIAGMPQTRMHLSATCIPAEWCFVAPNEGPAERWPREGVVTGISELVLAAGVSLCMPPF